MASNRFSGVPVASGCVMDRSTQGGPMRRCVFGFEVASIEREVYAGVVTEWKDCPAVERPSDRVSGAWVFKGTRIPVRALFENLEEGASVDDFLQWFPGVTRDQVVAVLAHAGESLTPA